LSAANYAVLGGEVWLAVEQTEIPPLFRLDDRRLILGLIRGRDGKDYVFHWDSEKKADESWSEYVRRSAEEALTHIRKMNVEDFVAAELAGSVYYNLTYINEKEWDDLD